MHQAPNGDRRRSLLELVTGQINEDMHQVVHRLDARRTLGPLPLLGRSAGPHTVVHHLLISRPENSAGTATTTRMCGNEGLGRTKTPEPGVMLPTRRQPSPRSPKKSGAVAPVSKSARRVAPSRAATKVGGVFLVWCQEREDGDHECTVGRSMRRGGPCM